MDNSKKIEWLIDRLSSVYCYNCNGQNCDDCSRKSMNWGISYEEAKTIVNILSKAGE